MSFAALACLSILGMAEPAPGWLEVGAGAIGTRYGFHGGSWGGTSALAFLGARHAFGAWSVEGELAGTLPVGPGPTGTAQLLLRAGWSNARFGVWLGPSVQLAPAAQPAWLVLPTARFRLSLNPVTLHLGVLDVHGLAPAHLSVDFRAVTLGYVAPLGARAAYRFTLGRPMTVEALYSRLGGANTLLVTLSLALGVGAEVAR